MVSAVSTSVNSTQEDISHLKLTTKRDELVAKLSIVSRAVSTRAVTQALSGILFAVDEGGVTLAATDGEMGLRTALEADVAGTGSVLLPGRLLSELARSLGDASVEIELRESERDVEIRSGGSSFHLRVLPAEDFPSLPDEGSEPLKIPAKALADTVELVARAASRDDMRPVLTGVLVTASGREMTMVATDLRPTSRPRRCASWDGSSPPPSSRRSRSACSPTRRFSRQARSSSTRG
jgi:DNA polymerase-3 subunit beta